MAHVEKGTSQKRHMLRKRRYEMDRSRREGASSESAGVASSTTLKIEQVTSGTSRQVAQVEQEQAVQVCNMHRLRKVQAEKGTSSNSAQLLICFIPYYNAYLIP
jgi:hypothetical protein